MDLKEEMDADTRMCCLVLASGSASGERSVLPTAKVSPLPQLPPASIPMTTTLLCFLHLIVHHGNHRALAGSQAGPFLPTQTQFLPPRTRLLRVARQMVTARLLPPVRSQNRMGTAHSFHAQALPRYTRRTDRIPIIRTRTLLTILRFWGGRNIYDRCTRTGPNHTRQLLQARD